jgi:hypothetical protein
MAFLGAIEAVRYRLCGGYRLSVPSLKRMLGEWDRMSPSDALGLQAAARVEAHLRRSTKVNISSLEVPVYFFDPTGQHYKLTYPCLTFDIIGTQPRYAEFVFQSDSYKGDMLQVPVATSKENVTVDGEDLGSHPRQARRRQVAHPLNIMIELRSYAKDPLVQSLLESHVYEQFHPRDFLRVPTKDGSYRSWDVIFQGSNELDKRDAVRSGSPGVEREYAKAYTFTIEGYFDNTDTSYLVNLVRTRSLNVEKMYGEEPEQVPEHTGSHLLTEGGGHLLTERGKRIAL